jgi:CelD/BcsL family acetyltransferase involved in cellulose biosynthesis
MMTWKYQIIEGYEFLQDAQLIDTWQKLVDYGECSHVFFTLPLVKAWLETYRPIRRIRPVIILAESENNKALLPLVIWRRNWKNAFIRVIVPIGYSDYDYHDPICKFKPSVESLNAFWKGLIDLLKARFNYDCIQLGGITDEAITTDINWRQEEICPLLHLDNIPDEPALMKSLKTSLRGDIRRQIRRLEELGELHFHEYTSWGEIPSVTFTEFMRQHVLRWPNAYKAPHFHENLLKEGLSSGLVHFSVLLVGDVEIAWHLGFSYRNRFYYYMPAGNQDYFKFSPTKIHLYFLVRRAVERGYAVFDHLRGEENYKSGWSNDAQYVNSCSFQNHDLLSSLKLNALKLKRHTFAT